MFCKFLKLVLPKKGEDGGTLKKPDFARALVEHYFADAPEDDKKKYIEGMCGPQRHVDPGILHIMAELDPENAADPGFLKVKKLAMEELGEKMLKKAADNKDDDDMGKAEKKAKERETKEKEAAEKERKERVKETQKRAFGLTPKELKDFLPGKGVDGLMSVEYHPILQHFRVKYPRFLFGNLFRTICFDPKK